MSFTAFSAMKITPGRRAAPPCRREARSARWRLTGVVAYGEFPNVEAPCIHTRSRTMSLSVLTIDALCREAAAFAAREATHPEPNLYGVTDGKAVGTYAEAKFKVYLGERYRFDGGNAAHGVDLPSVNVDLKVTSIKQPQSSSPFKSARQKVYGLGYSLLVFVYDKNDDAANKTSTLNFLHTIYIDQGCTADFQMTKSILDILKNGGNEEELVGLMQDRNLPLDHEIEAPKLARELIAIPPKQGYLTISNALQWRLQYTRSIESAGSVPGILRLR